MRRATCAPLFEGSDMFRLIRLIIVAILAFVCGILYERARAQEACPTTPMTAAPAYCERMKQ